MRNPGLSLTDICSLIQYRADKESTSCKRDIRDLWRFLRKPQHGQIWWSGASASPEVRSSTQPPVLSFIRHGPSRCHLFISPSLFTIDPYSNALSHISHGSFLSSPSVAPPFGDSFADSLGRVKEQKGKTINSRDSLVVTHPTTSLPAHWLEYG